MLAYQQKAIVPERTSAVQDEHVSETPLWQGRGIAAVKKREREIAASLRRYRQEYAPYDTIEENLLEKDYYH
jgi:hypothetical protein